VGATSACSRAEDGAEVWRREARSGGKAKEDDDALGAAEERRADSCEMF
jgi:hypothetical protein